LAVAMESSVQVSAMNAGLRTRPRRRPRPRLGVFSPGTSEEPMLRENASICRIDTCYRRSSEDENDDEDEYD
jgi:hypothetical protein